MTCGAGHHRGHDHHGPGHGAGGPDSADDRPRGFGPDDGMYDPDAAAPDLATAGLEAAGPGLAAAPDASGDDILDPIGVDTFGNALGDAFAPEQSDADALPSVAATPAVLPALATGAGDMP
jgi:hypothetical protein